ncbi:hypothetical protein KSC_013360 [Ktedonobacter sp. SOSP1-52]|uniref:nucleotidyltransferase domain-containing protein n=1 Tax=Ktedonobacter sp. SOSP1-52 TaxID=2778366 RepID=UPI001915FA0E|nr:nucleotidyltransferase domain-containing protein [Ktedonobacter sp. SOSP1-52]GHO62444.1 hypothetical protein KSC_013360 [Ktedonobacter sp. SOSP1-52]
MSIAFNDLVARFDVPEVRALVLMGSHARGEAGPYSDIDLVRFTYKAEPSEPESFLYQEHLLVVSTVGPDEVERWFHEPQAATDTIAGVRCARALLDREGYFAQIQARAKVFVWDDAMQQQANRWASEMLVGNAEEARKGLEGLRRNDVGRLLNARFGMSWSMSRVMKVQRGILLSGDNAIYDEVAHAMDDQPEWVRLRRAAFGIEDERGQALTLHEQVQAGLQLYALTARLLSPILLPVHKLLIEHTVSLIQQALPTASELRSER